MDNNRLKVIKSREAEMRENWGKRTVLIVMGSGLVLGWEVRVI